GRRLSNPISSVQSRDCSEIGRAGPRARPRALPDHQQREAVPYPLSPFPAPRLSVAARAPQDSPVIPAILLDFCASARVWFRHAGFHGKKGDSTMGIKIPDKLKADVPQTAWGKVLSSTPDIMTVVATLLAGLACSEMTHAQYSRALAAQQQSKTGDQWAFFQAKRVRSAIQSSTLDVLQTSAELHPLDAATLASFTPPAAPGKPQLDPTVQAALEAIEAGRLDAEVTALAAKVNDQTLAEAVRKAQENAGAFDAAVRPANKIVEQLESESAGKPNHRDVVAARLRYTAQRYDTESRLNQAIANLYELQVRKSNFTAERHERRSQRFFFGMLAAQAAVIIATLAIAARKRNLLWAV